MSSDERHPADFLAQLAYAIKAVRDRGGKWNKTADTIQWAHERIERLESKLDAAQSRLHTVMEMIETAHTYDSASWFADVLKNKLERVVERQ